MSSRHWQHPFYISVLVLVVGTLLMTVACQPPQATKMPQIPSTLVSLSSPSPVDNFSRLRAQSFPAPTQTAVEGERKVIYIDPDDGTRLFLVKPAKQEAAKEDLLNRFRTQQAVDTYPDIVDRITQIRYNPDYCQLYVVEIEVPEFRPQNKCFAEKRFVVKVDGETWAEFPALPLLVPANTPLGPTLSGIGRQRFIFAPCDNACTTPLQVEIFKTPGPNCKLSESQGYQNFDSQEPVAQFEYNDCMNRDSLRLYHDRSIRDLLDSVEKRVDVMKRKTDTLIRTVYENYPDTPPFSLQGMKIPARYYERGTSPQPFPSPDFQVQQYDPYDPYYDPYNEEGDDEFYCPEGNDCVGLRDIRKDVADAQNDRITREVELLRQKVAWAEQTVMQYQTQGFTTKSTVSVALNDALSDLQNRFYGVDTSQGCYNYYNYQARPKQPLIPRNSNGNGDNDPPCENLPPSLTLLSIAFDINAKIIARGRVNHAPELCNKEPINYQNVSLQFINDGITYQSGAATVIPEPGDQGFFRIEIPFGSYDYGDSYMEEANAFVQQAPESDWLPYIHAKLRLGDLESNISPMEVPLEEPCVDPAVCDCPEPEEIEGDELSHSSFNCAHRSFSINSVPPSFKLQQVSPWGDPHVTRVSFVPGGMQHNRLLRVTYKFKNQSSFNLKLFHLINDSTTKKRHKYFGSFVAKPFSVSTLQFPWDGKADSGQIKDGKFETETKFTLSGSGKLYTAGLGISQLKSEMTTTCSGYYDNYPYTLDADAIQHIMFRHHPLRPSSQALDFLELSSFIDLTELLYKYVQWVSIGRPNNYDANKYISKGKLEDHFDPRKSHIIRDSKGNYGKGDVFPNSPQWSEEKIKALAINMGNLEHGKPFYKDQDFDSCEKVSVIDSSQSYAITRTTQGITVITNVHKGKVKTTYPKSKSGGYKPIDYYTKVDTLTNQFGLSLPHNYTP